MCLYGTYGMQRAREKKTYTANLQLSSLPHIRVGTECCREKLRKALEIHLGFEVLNVEVKAIEVSVARYPCSRE